MRNAFFVCMSNLFDVRLSVNEASVREMLESLSSRIWRDEPGVQSYRGKKRPSKIKGPGSQRETQ
ncbi:hypothetical protein AWB83_01326 [Caballeronia ptereochthonis]|uniref:Uncharacterized protein n=1 Tax=Caballeronia ptereochthonis TaxID=1777144 RepID=A0A158A4V1_9BURK|nr:hypothetical protein AWB83_01326 [Caballeronia ptereochthonis]